MTPRETGQLLQRTREDKGLTLAEVQAETKIRERYLTALESGNFEIIPGDVYRRGFLRSYANFLGLDAAALLARELLPGSTAPPAAPTEATAPPAVERVSETPSPDSAPPRARRPAHAVPTRRVSPTLIALLVVLLAVVAYYSPRFFYGHRSGGKMPPRVVSKSSPRVARISPTLTMVSDRNGLVTYGVSPGPISVTASFSALCWVSVIADGRAVTPSPGIELSSGSVTWTAQKKLRIRFGYAPGVRLQVNGHNLGTAGTDTVNPVLTFRFLVGG